MSRLGRAGALAFVALAAAACGGSAPPAAAVGHVGAAPAKNEAAPSGGKNDAAFASEPTTVDEARAQIARAEAELRGGLEGAKKAESTGTEERPKAEPRSPAPPHEDKSLTDAPSCRTPCQALRSMRRAVDALCRMTGDADERCLEARKTLATSEVRAATCGC